jgi:hypothetical protein
MGQISMEKSCLPGSVLNETQHALDDALASTVIGRWIHENPRGDAADRFCRQHGDLRDRLGSRRYHNQIVSASLRRSCVAKGTAIALKIMQKATSVSLPSACLAKLAQELTDPIPVTTA